MRVLPEIRVERFEQLEPGDLFVFMDNLGKCLALKAVDPEQNGDKLILPLGPRFPERLGGPRLLPWQATTTASLGKDFILRLPTNPDGWSTVEPSREVFCLLVTSEATYFRANFSLQPGDFQSCLVRASDGVVIYHRANRSSFGVAAWATEWEIQMKDDGGTVRTLLRQPVI